MKEIQELKREELTIKQKLGMAWCAHIWDLGDEARTEAEVEYVLDMICNHSLGAVWIDPDMAPEIMPRIKEAADYPILIIRDAESGIAPHTIGRHNALGTTGSEELAYIFGKITAIHARNQGYNVVCNPVLDLCRGNSVCGNTVRSMGGNKEQVAKLGIAEAQGMHDGGVLVVGKHFPGADGDGTIDTHMAEKCSMETAQELIDYNMYPYLELNKRGLLDGIMTQHSRLLNIDPDYPVSLSKKVIGLFREQGFDGFAITDALIMMGTAAKFGARTCKGLAIGNGNDLALTWSGNEDSFEAIQETYEKGMIDDDRLDEAVRHVLEAQHKTLIPPKYTDITVEDEEKFIRINRDGVFAKVDEGLDVSISRDGRHYFVVLTPNDVEINDYGKVNVDTMGKGWYQPQRIIDRLMELFSNSTAIAINEFPSPAQNMHLLERNVTYDDVVFITFMESQAYVGKECLTSRIISVIQALQITNRVSTLVHFGNPYVVEDLVHISRILIGGMSAGSIECTLDVLAGDCPAKGVLTYDDVQFG